MPYIKDHLRYRLNDGIELISPIDPGELNYVITRLCHQYIERKGKNYETLNAVIGVLSCAQAELYRRVAAPYEDEKIISNGDVI